MKINKLLIFYIVLNVFSSSLIHSQGHLENYPNIVVIVVDDLGFYDLSFTGSQLYNTPNVDRLASASVSFTNAYSNYPRCVPSRYALMTSRYPVNENKGSLHEIPSSQNFIYQFNTLGYATSYVGKWHLGTDQNSPKGFGFKHSFAAGEAGGLASHFYPFNTKKNGKPAPHSVEDFEGLSDKGNYSSDLLTDASIDFIQKNENRPFLAVLAYYAVHTPIEAKQEDIQRNKSQLDTIDFGETPNYIKEGHGRRKMRQDDPAYAGLVENVDHNVGRVLATLNALNIANNTIIILTSDHGGLSNGGSKWKRHLATSNLPLKAGKGWLYEGGIRVPLFVSWPQKIHPKIETESIVLGMDVFPTLLDLVAQKLIANMDGISFKKVLLNQEKWHQRTVFWHSSKARPYSTGDDKSSAIRMGDYKLIDFYETDKTELYNLKKDVGELNDLSKSNLELTSKLKHKLDQWKQNHQL
ncbi:MAG: Arylsulfatase [Formosa sp. Hel1_33_131]|nr:MAG: Arylsulfatase [Formosa sp. Hel1_33_131]|tara:strand:+ start:270 stop:1670 length:1401 start_codon:yes stop_codon:yes gene_type:complete